MCRVIVGVYVRFAAKQQHQTKREYIALPEYFSVSAIELCMININCCTLHQFAQQSRHSFLVGCSLTSD